MLLTDVFQMPERTDYGGKRNREDEQYRKLFIGGLTYSTTDEMLKDFYSQWGEIVDCIVMRDSATKRSRGFGFVTYSENAMVDVAMENRPHIIDGKEVEPKRAVPREFSNKPENHMSVKRLYVSGIKDEHTEDMFKEYFTEFGQVTEVEIVTDKATGKRRGFAFVTFEDYDSVDKCVLKRSHMVDNKRCDVKKALSKEEMRKAQQMADRSERDFRSRGPGMRDGGWGPGGGWGGGGGWNQGGGWGPGGGWNQGPPYGGGPGGFGGGYGGGGGGNYGGGPGGAGYGGNPGWGGGQQQWQQPSAGTGGWQAGGGWNQGGGGGGAGWGAGGSQSQGWGGGQQQWSGGSSGFTGGGGFVQGPQGAR